MKKSSKLLAGILCVVMIMSLMACKKDSQLYSSYWTSEYEEVSDDTANQNETNGDNTQSGSKIDSTNPGKGTTSTTNNPSGGKNVFKADPYSDIPSSVKGSTVKLAVWYTLPEEEKQAIAAFEKKTGIKVSVIQAASTKDYKDKIVSMMAAETPPDIVCITEETFPVWTYSVLDPLDESTFRLDDPIWDKSVMDPLKVNNKYYGVNISGSWSNESLYVLYYNSDVFEDNGLKTPRELWKANRWNWTTMESLMRDVKKYVPDIIPLSFYDGITMACSAGTDFIKYDGTKLINNSGDAKLTQAYTTLTTWTKDGLCKIFEYYADALSSGKIAMLSGIMYGMKSNNGFWAADKGLRTGTLDAVPFPSPEGESLKVAYDAKLFGTPKGAGNKAGAAYFLRYFLDPANYNMDSLFLNKNLQDTYNAVIKAEKCPTYSTGPLMYIKANNVNEVLYNVLTSDPSQVSVAIQKNSGVIDTAVNRVNKQVFGK